MKPIELMGGLKGSYRAVKRVVNKYFNVDCVIGYYDCPIGVVFLMKGQNNFFLMYNQKNVYSDAGYPLTKLTRDKSKWNDEVARNEYKFAIKLIEEQGHILDRALWDKFLNKEFMEAL
jgi:hypothetical protein